MRKNVLPILMMLVVSGIVSCAAQFPLIASVAQSEMADMQSLCIQQKLSLGEIALADSLAAAGALLLEKGKREAAYALFDRATVCYRIALIKSSIIFTENKIAAEEQLLAKTREDVSAYKQVLMELKTLEQQ